MNYGQALQPNRAIMLQIQGKILVNPVIAIVGVSYECSVVARSKTGSEIRRLATKIGESHCMMCESAPKQGMGTHYKLC